MENFQASIPFSATSKFLGYQHFSSFLQSCKTLQVLGFMNEKLSEPWQTALMTRVVNSALFLTFCFTPLCLNKVVLP